MPTASTSFKLLDTSFIANAQLAGNLQAMLELLNRAGIKIIIPDTIYIELDDWGVAKAQLDAYRAANPGAVEIWEASRYGGTDHSGVPSDELPKNAGDNALAELHRYLEGEGYHRGQIDIHSEEKFRAEIKNPGGPGNVPLVRDANGKPIPPVNWSDTLRRAVNENWISPENANEVARGYYDTGKDGVFDQPWDNEGYTRQLPDGTIERTYRPTSSPPSGEGWISDTDARALSQDIANRQAQAAADFEAEASRIRNDPASYTPDGRFTPEAATAWTNAQKALGVLGVALGIWDAYETGERIAERLNHEDYEGAANEASGLLGRLLGGLYGAELGLVTGGFWGMLIGGVAGVIVGDSAMRTLADSLSDLLRDILGDPLVLDLDGDGIELTALASSATMFDMDGDGLLERVGWAGPHDGLLVQDANGNGLVDGVDELFGSANVDGYDELLSLDANQDGRIDASDLAFAQLLVWRDLNADGISTADEMLTLAQAGIARFNLGYTQSDTDVAGNIIARIGTYARTDGTTRAMGSVQFALDESGNKPVIPEGADTGDLRALPNLPGMLALPDLRTAMYFDATLRALVHDLVFGDHDFDTFVEFEQGGFLDVLYRWAGVDDSVPLEEGDQPYFIQALAAFMGRPFDELNPHQLERLEKAWPDFVKQLGIQFLFQAAHGPELKPFLDLAEDLTALDLESPTFVDDAITLIDSAVAATEGATPAYPYLELFTGIAWDSMTGRLSGDFDAFVATFIEDQPSFFVTGMAGGGFPSTQGGALGGVRHPWTAWYEDQGSLLFYVADAMGIGPDYVMNVTGWRWLFGDATDLEGTSGNDVIDQAITHVDRIGDDGETIVQIETHDQRMFGYEGNDELRGNDGVDRLVGGAGDDLLKGGSDSDMYVYASGDGLDRIIEDGGADDTIYFSSELNRADLRVDRLTGTNDLLLHFGNPASGIILTGQWSSPAAAIDNIHFVAEDGLNTGDIASLYLATFFTENADILNASWAGEQIAGLGGDDQIAGAGGSDTIDGGSGNDWLWGEADNDHLSGGEGADTLQGNVGNDVLAGGPADDWLLGAEHDDTYVYSIGGGNDVIEDHWGVWGEDEDSLDTLIFGSGITTANLAFERVATDWRDVKINIVGVAQTGSILLQNQNGGDDGIEQVIFADGTVWNHAQLMARYVSDQQTSGSDTIWGSNLVDNVQGGEGNDYIATRHGNDVLAGGIGDDLLQGDEHNDTYVYNLGDGNDEIYDFWGVWGEDEDSLDTLLFGSGITAANLLFERVANDWSDVKINIVGVAQTGSILLQSQNGKDSGIEQVTFADGTVWSHAQLLARYVSDQQTSGNDTIWGSNLGDNIQAGGGDDVVEGQLGNDTIAGGIGNDSLLGGGGNDVYLFGRGDGLDIVSDRISNFSRGGYDAVVLGPDIGVADVTIGKADNGASYVFYIDGGGESLKVLGGATWGADYYIEELRFADGTVWAASTFESRWYGATASIDNLVGDSNANVMHGLGGDDAIGGLAGDDTLVGDGGNDTLEGGEGADVLIGGFGANVLDGGEGLDRVDYSQSSAGVSIDLATGIADNGYGAMDQLVGIEDLTGSSFNDVLTGNAEANILDGGLGADAMTGGGGNDTYVVDDLGDLVVEAADGGIDLIESSVSFTLGANQENLTLAGTAAIIGTGNEQDNTIIGNSGNNSLNGGTGADTMNGGDGDDVYYVDSSGDALVESSALGGADTVRSSVGYILGANLETLILEGTAAIGGIGNELNNTIFGNNADNSLNGGLGADSLRGGDGNDDYLVDNVGDVVIELGTLGGTDIVNSSVTFLLGANLENLTLTGAAAIDGTGNALDNVLNGNDGANILNGVAGADTMIGGLGNDTYFVDNSGDQAVESSGAGGIDIVKTTVSFTLAAHVENLTFLGSTAITATGNALDNVIVGNGASNLIDGGGGADSMNGGLGDDTYVVDNSGDLAIETSASGGTDQVQSSASFTLGSNIESLILTGVSAINGTGNNLANTLTGNDASNVLNGASGADTMTGGLGDDTYVVDNAGDLLVEQAGGGVDTVQASINHILGSELENLVFTGTGNLTGIGNAAANNLTGNSGANWLDGGLGADSLIGGLGNDTYVVDDAADAVVEDVAAGTDAVRSSISYTLVAEIENLTLTGTASLSGTGNALANALTGNDAANILDGNVGADFMSGGLGDDTYVVDDAGDVVSELAGQGTDTVQSAISYILGSSSENLTLTGTNAINATGNVFSNILIGNAAANILNGSGGADQMSGGLGDDTYVVDSADDTVTEAIAAGGTDQVESSVTFTLGSNIENLILTGASAINGTGNNLANALTGNDAANVLNGGFGADTMAGGLGNDTYVIDNVADAIVELAGEGIDTVTVQASLNYTLGSEIENLVFTGTSNLTGIGNAAANSLTGNSGANTLDGGLGADTLSGGLGNDTYVVDDALDQVIEAAGAGTDTVQTTISYTLGAGIENLTLTGTATLSGTGNDLANTLTGNDAANILDGGLGADFLRGGLGDDTYVVDDAGDVVSELAGQGTDTVESAISYTLGSSAENLSLTGTNAINATGNVFANILIGNAAANILDGGGGADQMSGGLGDDTYVVNNAGDTVTEASASGGLDQVQSSVAFTLGANQEYLIITGGSAVAGTGNELDNVIIGNGAINALSGGAGADQIHGGLGNDILNGGAGADGFYFDTALNGTSNVDAITGFSAVDDTFFLDRSVFAGIAAAGTLDASAFRAGNVALDADDRILYDSSTGQVFYDADGSGAEAAVLFATVGSGATLTSADFIAY